MFIIMIYVDVTYWIRDSMRLLYFYNRDRDRENFIPYIRPVSFVSYQFIILDFAFSPKLMLFSGILSDPYNQYHK